MKKSRSRPRIEHYYKADRAELFPVVYSKIGCHRRGDGNGSQRDIRRWSIKSSGTVDKRHLSTGIFNNIEINSNNEYYYKYLRHSSQKVPIINCS
jgi:hypothetical protein